MLQCLLPLQHYGKMVTGNGSVITSLNSPGGSTLQYDTGARFAVHGVVYSSQQDLYSALFVVPHTRGTQALITEFYLQSHQCLP